MQIDSHQHFWKYDPAEYGWIGPDMARLRRDFLPEDLREATAGAGIDGVISVQARQTLEETDWLLALARNDPLIKGVVGWVPLTDPAVGEHLERLAVQPKFKGVRHVLQGEADEHYMLREDFNAGVGLLKVHGLAYDLLIFERHLPQTTEFVDRHPGQVFILDHIAKPRIRDGLLEPWSKNVCELARRQNVFCKLSGLVTEADWSGWREDQLVPYLDTVLEAFGTRRVMFGSDWPVCLVASSYARWLALVRRHVARFSLDEREAVCGGTAAKTYGVRPD